MMSRMASSTCAVVMRLGIMAPFVHPEDRDQLLPSSTNTSEYVSTEPGDDIADATHSSYRMEDADGIGDRTIRDRRNRGGVPALGWMGLP